MKIKTSKLSLKKETIARLDMNSIKGGTGTVTMTTTTTAPCGHVTVITEACVQTPIDE